MSWVLWDRDTSAKVELPDKKTVTDTKDCTYWTNNTEVGMDYNSLINEECIFEDERQNAEECVTFCTNVAAKGKVALKGGGSG